LFDGDGDRVVFFNEQGKPIDVAHAFSALVEFYITKSRGFKSIVVSSSFSKVAGDVVENIGGRYYISPVGRTNVTPLMRSKRALLGAERSGHYFFKDFGYEDSGILALLKVLEVVSQQKEPISKMVESYDKYFSLPEINLPKTAGTENSVLRAVKENFAGHKFSKIDGLTMNFKDWWFNLRPSNTQDFWRLTIEGVSEDVVRSRQLEIEEIVRSFATNQSVEVQPRRIG